MNMKMNIHDVSSITIERTQDFNSFKCRTLIIRDANGTKYEITLFADDAAKIDLGV